MKNKIVGFILLLFITTNISYASWYNPFTWFEWFFKAEKQQVILQQVVEVPAVPIKEEAQPTVVQKEVKPKPVSPAVDPQIEINRKKELERKQQEEALRVEQQVEANRLAKAAEDVRLREQQEQLRILQERQALDVKIQQQRVILKSERLRMLQEYNASILILQQQIYAIKTKYYEDAAALEGQGRGIPLSIIRRNQDRLLEEANAKIEAINTQIDLATSVYEANRIPSAICNDGTASYSMNNSGTCSYHGGVLEWIE